MDKLRINKQEMSHPQKHIIIEKSNNPALIDFERCKYTLNPSNVTQFCDFLSSTNIIATLKNYKINIDKNELINEAIQYKKHQNNKNFNDIIKILR